MGRPKTTGRFRTRAELVDRIRSLYFNPDFNLSMSGVARHCRVSPVTANTIIDTKEWETLEPHDLDHMEEPFEVDVNLNQQSCGVGYTPTECPVHLPSQLLNDLLYSHDIRAENVKPTPSMGHDISFRTWPGKA